MVYSYTFHGRFEFDRRLPNDVLRRFLEIQQDRVVPHLTQVYHADLRPRSECCWVLTPDQMGLEWDGTEKWRFFTEWMDWLIENIFAPGQIKVTGRVQYCGDVPEDQGWIVAEGDSVRKIPGVLVPEPDLKALRQFRDLVENSPFGDEIQKLLLEQKED